MHNATVSFHIAFGLKKILNLNRDQNLKFNWKLHVLLIRTSFLYTLSGMTGPSGCSHLTYNLAWALSLWQTHSLLATQVRQVQVKTKSEQNPRDNSLLPHLFKLKADNLEYASESLSDKNLNLKCLFWNIEGFL